MSTDERPRTTDKHQQTTPTNYPTPSKTADINGESSKQKTTEFGETYPTTNQTTDIGETTEQKIVTTSILLLSSSLAPASPNPPTAENDMDIASVIIGASAAIGSLLFLLAVAVICLALVLLFRRKKATPVESSHVNHTDLRTDSEHTNLPTPAIEMGTDTHIQQRSERADFERSVASSVMTEKPEIFTPVDDDFASLSEWRQRENMNNPFYASVSHSPEPPPPEYATVSDVRQVLISRGNSGHLLVIPRSGAGTHEFEGTTDRSGSGQTALRSGCGEEGVSGDMSQGSFGSSHPLATNTIDHDEGISHCDNEGVLSCNDPYYATSYSEEDAIESQYSLLSECPYMFPQPSNRSQEGVKKNENEDGDCQEDDNTSSNSATV